MPEPVDRALLLRLAIRVSCVAACAIPVASFILAFPLANPLPRWDQWALIPLWEAHCAGRPVLPHLLEPYNNHLNVVPRILLYGIGVLTGWDLRVEVVIVYLLACATAATLVRMLSEEEGRLLLLAAPVTALVFSFAQYETFLTGFHVGQHLEQLALTVTVFLVTRPRLTPWHALGAAVAAAVATFSWGGGLLAWPLGLAALAVRRWRRPGLAALWIVPAALCLLTVKRGAFGAQPVSMADVFHLLDPMFVLTMSGRAVTPHGFPHPSEALKTGAVLALAFALGLAWAWVSRRRLLGLRWGLLGASAFANAALVSITRSRAGLEHAVLSHYATATYPLAVAVLVLAGCALLAHVTAPASRLRQGTAALLLGCLIAATAWQVEKASRETFFALRGWYAFSVAIDEKLIAGTVTDQEIQTALHPDTQLVRRGTESLRRCGLAVFRHRRGPS